MRDDDERQAIGAAHVPEQLKQPAPALPVEARERLVEDEHTRTRCQQARDRDPSHLAAAQLIDAAAGQFRRQTDTIKVYPNDGAPLLRCQPHVEPGGGEDVLLDGRPLQLQPGVLKRQRYRSNRIRGGHAVEQDGAVGRLDQPGEHPGERGLARPVLPRDQQPLALMDV